jgi:RNA polymerase sigma factor (sigma-70 family)
LLDDAIDSAFDEFRSAARCDDAEDWRVALSGCMERIPERGRSVLKARFNDEMGYQAIGEHVGMTIEAVRKALFRLKNQIRSCVEANLRGAS